MLCIQVTNGCSFEQHRYDAQLTKLLGHDSQLVSFKNNTDETTKLCLGNFAQETSHLLHREFRGTCTLNYHRRPGGSRGLFLLNAFWTLLDPHQHNLIVPHPEIALPNTSESLLLPKMSACSLVVQL